MYNPLGLIKGHKVFFSTIQSYAYQDGMAAQVTQYLDTLTVSQLKVESVKFYKWIVVRQPGLEMERYATALLQYFHGKGLLLAKQTVRRCIKHRQPKYLVHFTIGDEQFSQLYNSIREIREDTGLSGKRFIKQRTKIRI